jgi:hypothetical protein
MLVFGSEPLYLRLKPFVFALQPLSPGYILLLFDDHVGSCTEWWLTFYDPYGETLPSLDHMRLARPLSPLEADQVRPPTRLPPGRSPLYLCLYALGDLVHDEKPVVIEPEIFAASAPAVLPPTLQMMPLPSTAAFFEPAIQDDLRFVVLCELALQVGVELGTVACRNDDVASHDVSPPAPRG